MEPKAECQGSEESAGEQLCLGSHKGTARRRLCPRAWQEVGEQAGRGQEELATSKNASCCPAWEDQDSFLIFGTKCQHTTCLHGNGYFPNLPKEQKAPAQNGAGDPPFPLPTPASKNTPRPQLLPTIPALSLYPKYWETGGRGRGVPKLTTSLDLSCPHLQAWGWRAGERGRVGMYMWDRENSPPFPILVGAQPYSDTGCLTPHDWRSWAWGIGARISTGVGVVLPPSIRRGDSQSLQHPVSGHLE